MARENSIAVLVVMYRDVEYLPFLMGSLHKQSDVNYQVFAIDNDEEQLSARYLIECEPKALCYPYQSNLGYTAGNNYLAMKAIEAGYKYIFIVNPDIILGEKCLYSLLSVLQNKTETAIAGPLVFKGTPGKSPVIQFYELSADFKSGYTRMITGNSVSSDHLKESAIVNMVSGSAFLIKSDAIEKCGLFNEENFMYGDEVDLAFRLKINGYEGIVTKSAFVWHNHIERSINKQALLFEYFYKTRNRILFIKRYNHQMRLFMDILKELLLLPVRLRWLYRIAGFKMIRYYYLGYIYGLSGIKGKVKIIG